MNPELRRNLWLEFSLHRVVAMPVVIALCAILIVAMSRAEGMANVAAAAAYGFAAIVLLWGTQLAGMSVIEETRARTWDAQRMSSIGPWAMTWGKLAGAPSFAWYGGVILLALYVVGGWGRLGLPLLRSALTMAAAAVLLHALALTAGVLAARKGSTQRSAGVLALVVLALVLMFPAAELMADDAKSVAWWRVRFAGVDFLLGSIAAYAAWAVFGAYRTMCTELEIRTLPWALPAFIGFNAAYLAGFVADGSAGVGSGYAVLFFGAATALAAFYLLLFGEQTRAAAWHRLIARAGGGQWRRALEDLPLWSVALAAAIAFAAGATLAPPAPRARTLFIDIGPLPLAIAIFAVRDAALFQFFALAREPRRAEAATLFYLVLLYWLVPGLLTAAGASTVADWILPPVATRPAFAIVIVAMQAVIAVYFALWRWQRNHGSGSRTPPPAGARVE